MLQYSLKCIEKHVLYKGAVMLRWADAHRLGSTQLYVCQDEDIHVYIRLNVAAVQK